MNLRSKLTAAHNALIAGTQTANLPAEANLYPHLAHPLLDHILSSKAPDDTNEQQIAIILSGSVVIALVISDLMINRNYYTKKYHELCSLCKVPDTEAQMVSIGSNNPIYGRYNNFIIDAGTKILAGELPFDSAEIAKIFPELTDHFNIINNRIKKSPTDRSFPTVEEMQKMAEERLPGATRIDNIFKEALSYSNVNAAGANEQHKRNFFNELKILQLNTLADFNDNKPMFNLENCLLIANSALELAKKVGDGTVNQADCNKFNKATEPFKKSKWLHTVVNAMLGAIAFMLLGIAVGLMVSGPMCAAIGAGIGFFAGGLGFGYQTKSVSEQFDPQLQMVTSARAVIR